MGWTVVVHSQSFTMFGQAWCDMLSTNPRDRFEFLEWTVAKVGSLDHFEFREIIGWCVMVDD